MKKLSTRLPQGVQMQCASYKATKHQSNDATKRQSNKATKQPSNQALTSNTQVRRQFIQNLSYLIKSTRYLCNTVLVHCSLPFVLAGNLVMVGSAHLERFFLQHRSPCVPWPPYFSNICVCCWFCCSCDECQLPDRICIWSSHNAHIQYELRLQQLPAQGNFPSFLQDLQIRHS